MVRRVTLDGALLPLFSYKNSLAYPYLYQREWEAEMWVRP